MKYTNLYEEKRTSVEECLGLIRSGDVVFIAGDGNCPLLLGSRFHEIADRVENVRVFKDFTNYLPFPAMDNMKGRIFAEGFFFGRDLREGLPKGNSSFLPSDINMSGRFISENKPTVFIAAVTPMDEDGYFQIGLSNMGEPEVLEYVRAHKGRIVLEVNATLPRVNGALTVHVSEVSALVESDLPVTYIRPAEASAEEKAVAENVRELLKDGDCIQIGIGSLPNAIANCCMDLHDLGMHTEMLTSSMAKMVEKGVITGERKNINPKEHIFTFVGGDEETFALLKNDPHYRIVPASYGCDPFVIAQNDNMVSINTCIEMDLTGQIASESIGTNQYSGSGGALCYAYGAMRSKGGRGIYAFTSRTINGISKIKGILTPGAAVTVPRNYADYIVTEYGIASLMGKSIKERAEQLISIAHPDFRDELRAEAKKNMWI